MLAAIAIVQVVVGSAHTCALADDGTVSCWGQNSFGQLGDGTDHDRATAAPVPGLRGAVSLSAEGARTCARLRGGELVCWGDKQLVPKAVPRRDIAQLAGPCLRLVNGRASCKNGSMRSVDVPGVTDAVDIAAHQGIGCAAHRSGAVSCWFEPDETEQIPGIIGAVDVAVGASMACARDRMGAVWCWQWSFEPMGKARRPLRQFAVKPKRVVAAGATELVDGFDRVCALSRGDVRCFDFAMKRVPLPALGTVRSLAIGGHSCAVRDGRDVVCWGNDGDGQLGNGWADDHPTPTLVPGIRDAVAIETSYSPGTGGSQWSCAKARDGRVRCWGSLSPNNSSEHSATPKLVRTGITRQAGEAFMCSLEEDGEVTCRTESGVHRVIAVPQAISFSAGMYAACAVRSDHSVWCWQGPYKNPIVTAPTDGTPVKIAGLPAISRISLGQEHACALADDGGVWCWGADELGQTGGATTKPARVYEHAVQVSAGTHHTCALRADGQVACWGEATTGQIGTYATESFDKPVAVIWE